MLGDNIGMYVQRLRKLLKIFGFYLLFSVGCSFLMSVSAQERSDNGLGLLKAVQITLERQPDILFQKEEAEKNKGVLQQERGNFDTGLGISLDYDHEETPLLNPIRLNERTNTATSTLDISKTFRNGVQINPTVQLIQTDSDLPRTATENDATVNFQIIIPLLKGWGVKATGANERAYTKNYEASVLLVHHAFSQDTLNTVQNYWNYLSAKHILDRRIESENISKNNLDAIKMLVEGDQIPAADIEEIAASLAQRTALRIDAEQSLVEAKHNLGLSMGLPLNLIETLPLPTDTFPKVSREEVEKISEQAHLLIEQSLSRRADYRSLKITQEANKILVEAAKNNMLPQLDLQVGVGYAGMKDGSNLRNYTESLTSNVPGYSGSVSLVYQWPFRNNSARGLFLQTMAAYRQAVIQSDDLARNIRSRVIQFLSGLKNNVSELAKYEEAVELYRKTVDNQKEKFMLGMSTLTDVISTEDNLDNSLINQISSQASLANTLAQLRYETGTLLAVHEDRVTITQKELTTVPAVEDLKKTSSPNQER